MKSISCEIKNHPLHFPQGWPLLQISSSPKFNFKCIKIPKSGQLATGSHSSGHTFCRSDRPRELLVHYMVYHISVDNLCPEVAAVHSFFLEGCRTDKKQFEWLMLLLLPVRPRNQRHAGPLTLRSIRLLRYLQSKIAWRQFSHQHVWIRYLWYQDCFLFVQRDIHT